MNQQKLNYIHYYLLAIVTSILIWGGFEYITICNGQNCMFNTSRLWKGLAIITLIFIPITLCIWSTYANSVIRFLLNNLKTQIKIQYEEKTLLFAVLIFVALFAASLTIFNVYWNYYVGDDVIEKGKNFSKYGKEYMAATANVAVFSATLFAPIAALILYDNWKVQKNYDLNKEILLSIDNIIFEIYNDLFKKINCLTVLNEIDNYKIQIENYEDNKKISNHINELNQLQSKIELYDALNKKELKNHFNNFGGAIFRIVHISNEIYSSYDEFALKIKIKNTNNTIFDRYNNSEKIIYRKEIENVKKSMLKNHRYQSNENATSIFLNFDEAFIEFKNQYNIITKEVRDKIKA